MADSSNRFVFFFGKNPVLSLAELANYAKTNSLNWIIEPIWPNAALVSGTIFDPSKITQRLGGTFKIAVLKHALPSLKPADFQKILNEKTWLNLLPEKFVFAVSSLGLTPQQEQTANEHLKIIFKAAGYKNSQKKGSNRKTITENIASPSEILKWNLLKNQTDIVIAKILAQFELGYTVAVSNPNDWKFRDENRPFKDSKELVSIRLAKILLNIAATKPIHTVLDPFCGYGTILQEAMLQNWNAIGIEKDQQKVRQTEKNLKWITEKFHPKAEFQIFLGSAENVNRVVQVPFDLVVTEPYLGPYRTKKPTIIQAGQIIVELQTLYRAFFDSLAQKMKTGQTVCVIFPVLVPFQSPNQKISTAVFSNHFEPVNPLASFGEKFANSFPFEYQNPNNLMKRQIWLLVKKPFSVPKPNQ
ncbi:MAG: DNA methyltransferase [Candidatus Micrarchaeota archaeon]